MALTSSFKTKLNNFLQGLSQPYSHMMTEKTGGTGNSTSPPPSPQVPFPLHLGWKVTSWMLRPPPVPGSLTASNLTISLPSRTSSRVLAKLGFQRQQRVNLWISPSPWWLRRPLRGGLYAHSSLYLRASTLIHVCWREGGRDGHTTHLTHLNINER